MGFMSFNRIKSDCRHVIKKWQTHDLRLAIHWKRNTAKKESFSPHKIISTKRFPSWSSFAVEGDAVTGFCRSLWRALPTAGVSKIIVASLLVHAPSLWNLTRAFVDLREAKTCRRRFWRRKRDWSRAKARLRAAIADQIHFIQLSQKHALKRADLQTRSE